MAEQRADPQNERARYLIYVLQTKPLTVAPVFTELLERGFTVVRGAVPAGGHGFALCQGLDSEDHECCDWPKAARRFLQDVGVAPERHALDVWI